MSTPTSATGAPASPVLGRHAPVDTNTQATTTAPVGVAANAVSTLAPAPGAAAAPAPVASEGFLSSAWTYVKSAVVGVYDRIVNLLSSIWSAITGCFSRAPAAPAAAAAATTAAPATTTAAPAAATTTTTTTTATTV